jgi:probable HAF family extracellular repeat protein
MKMNAKLFVMTLVSICFAVPVAGCRTAVHAAKERLDKFYQARDALRSRPVSSAVQTCLRKAGWTMALGGFMTTASAAQWTIIDLGSIGGTYSDSKGINDHRQVVGSAYTSGNASYHAFLFDHGTMMDLGTLGGINSAATGINNDGIVVGSSYTAHDTVEHAFVYHQSGSMTDLGTLGGKYKNSVARGVNKRGQVVGYSDTTRGAGPHAFLYSHGRMRDLGTLGGTSSTARAINDGGWVAGDANVAGDHAYHAFLYRNGTLQDLGTLGGRNSTARAINGSGWVAGDADTAVDAAHHVFLYRHGTMQDLGSLGGKNSVAYGINNRGQVVGYSDTTPIMLHFKLSGGGPVREVALRRQTAGFPKDPVDDTYPVHSDGQVVGHLGYLYEYSHHAFLYDVKGGMLDLSQLPEVQAAGWSSLNYAYAINERGEIIGSGTIGDKSHAFLLSPVTALGR